MSKIEPTHHVDEFGVPHWTSTTEGDTWCVAGNDPFTKMLKWLNMSKVDQRLVDRAVWVHDDLEVARSIAVSIFGKTWSDHVFEIYDRMQMPKTPYKLSE